MLFYNKVSTDCSAPQANHSVLGHHLTLPSSLLTQHGHTFALCKNQPVYVFIYWYLVMNSLQRLQLAVV